MESDSRPQRSPLFILCLLGSLSVVSPFSIDMYLTAYLKVASDFGVPTSAISLTLSAYFIGLASPAAAALVAGTVWAFADFDIQGAKVSLLFALMVAAAGMLMVSNIKYHSFKDLDLHGRVPFVAILVVVLAFAVVFTDPPRILLLLFLAYAASGPVQYLLQLRRRRRPS